jgi:hypothetical protein
MTKDFTTKRCVNITTGAVKFVPAWITQDANLMKKHNLKLQDYEKKDLYLFETAVNVQSADVETTINEVEPVEKKKRRRK